MITRQPVQSSNIRSVGYDPAELLLEVEFASGGVYRYQGVSRETYEEFIGAESMGRFFGGHIRGRFEFEMVPQKQETQEEK